MKTTLKMLSIPDVGLGVILAINEQGAKKWESEVSFWCLDTIYADDSASVTLAQVENVKGWQDADEPVVEGSEAWRIQRAIRGEIPYEVTATLDADINWED